MIAIVVAARTLITYFILILIVKTIIKEENKKLKELDTITILVIVFIGSNMIINYEKSIIIYISFFITIIFLREILKMILKKRKQVQDIFEKEPIILVRNGKICFKNLVENKLTINKLGEKLKNKGIYDINKIRYVFLKEDGQVDIITYDEVLQEKYPLPVILEGIINKKVLKELGVNENKIKRILEEEQLNIKDIYYAMYKKDKLYIIRNMD